MPFALFHTKLSDVLHTYYVWGTDSRATKYTKMTKKQTLLYLSNVPKELYMGKWNRRQFNGGGVRAKPEGK